MEHLSHEILSAHLDGELRGAEAEAVRAHLESCGRCRGELDALEAVSGFYGRLEGMAAPDALRERLKQQAEAREDRPGAVVAPMPERPERRRWNPMSIGMAASLVILASLVFTAMRYGLWDAKQVPNATTPNEEPAVDKRSKATEEFSVFSGALEDRNEQAPGSYRQAENLPAAPTPEPTRGAAVAPARNSGASGRTSPDDSRVDRKPSEAETETLAKSQFAYGNEDDDTLSKDEGAARELGAFERQTPDGKQNRKQDREKDAVDDSELRALARRDRAVEPPREVAEAARPAMKAPAPTMQADPNVDVTTGDGLDKLEPKKKETHRDNFGDVVGSREEAQEKARQLEERPLPPVEWEVAVYQVPYEAPDGTALGVLSMGIRAPRAEDKGVGGVVIHCEPGRERGYGDRLRPVQAALLPTGYRWPALESIPAKWQVDTPMEEGEKKNTGVLDPTTTPPPVPFHMEGRFLVLEDGQVLGVRLPLWLKGIVEAAGFRAGACPDGRPASTVMEFEADWMPAGE